MKPQGCTTRFAVASGFGGGRQKLSSLILPPTWSSRPITSSSCNRGVSAPRHTPQQHIRRDCVSSLLRGCLCQHCSGRQRRGTSVETTRFLTGVADTSPSLYLGPLRLVLRGSGLYVPAAAGGLAAVATPAVARCVSATVGMHTCATSAADGASASASCAVDAGPVPFVAALSAAGARFSAAPSFTGGLFVSFSTTTRATRNFCSRGTRLPQRAAASAGAPGASAVRETSACSSSSASLCSPSSSTASSTSPAVSSRKAEQPERGTIEDAADPRADIVEDLRGVDFYVGARPLAPFRRGKPASHSSLRSPLLRSSSKPSPSPASSSASAVASLKPLHSPSPSASSSSTCSSNFYNPFAPPFPGASSAAERMRRVDVDPAAWQQEAAAERLFEDEGWHLFVTSTRSATAHILHRQSPHHGTGLACTGEPSCAATGEPTAGTRPSHMQKLPSVTGREAGSERALACVAESSDAQVVPPGSAYKEAQRPAGRTGGEMATVEAKDGRATGGGRGGGGNEELEGVAAGGEGSKRKLSAAALRGRRGSLAATAAAAQFGATSTTGVEGESTTAVEGKGPVAATGEGGFTSSLTLDRGGGRATAMEPVAAAAAAATAAAERQSKHQGLTETAVAAAASRPAIAALPGDLSNTGLRRTEKEDVSLSPAVQRKRGGRETGLLSQVTESEEETRVHVETRQTEETLTCSARTVPVGARARREQDAEEVDSGSAKPHESEGSKARRWQGQQPPQQSGKYLTTRKSSLSAGHVESCKGEAAAACCVIPPPTSSPISSTESSNSSSRFLSTSKQLKLDGSCGGGMSKKGYVDECGESSGNRPSSGVSPCSRARGRRLVVAAFLGRRAHPDNSSSGSDKGAGISSSSTLPRQSDVEGGVVEPCNIHSKAVCSSSNNSAGRSSSREGKRCASSTEEVVAGKSSSSGWWERHRRWSVGSSPATASRAASNVTNLPASSLPFGSGTAASHRKRSNRSSSNLGLTALDIPPPPLTYFDVMNRLDGDAPHPAATERGDAGTTGELDEARSNAAATRKRGEATTFGEFFPALPPPRALSSFFTGGHNDWRYHLTREDDMIHEASCTKGGYSVQQERCYETPWSPAASPAAAGTASYAADIRRRGAKPATGAPGAEHVGSLSRLPATQSNSSSACGVYDRSRSSPTTVSSSQTFAGDRNLCVFVPSLGRWKPIALLSAQQLLFALQQPAASLGNINSSAYFHGGLNTSGSYVALSRGDADTRATTELLHLQLQQEQHQHLPQQRAWSQQLRGMSAPPYLSVASPVSTASYPLSEVAPTRLVHALPVRFSVCASNAVSPDVSAVHLAASPPVNDSSSTVLWPFLPVPLDKDNFFPLHYWRELLQRLQRIAFSFDTPSFLAVVSMVYVHLKRVRAAVLHTQDALDRHLSLYSFWSQRASAAASAAEHAAAAAEAAGAATATATGRAGTPTCIAAADTTATTETVAAASDAAVSTNAAQAVEAAAAAKAAAAAAARAAEAARKVEEKETTSVKQLQEQLDVLRCCYFTLAQRPLWKCLGDNLPPHLPFVSLSELAALAEAFSAAGPQHASVTSVLALQATDKLHELHLKTDKAILMEQRQQQKRGADATPTAHCPVAGAACDAAAGAAGGCAAGGSFGAGPSFPAPAFGAPSLASRTATADHLQGAAGTAKAASGNNLAIPALLHLLDVFSEGAYAAAGVSVSPWTLPSLDSFAACVAPAPFSSAWDAEPCYDFFEQQTDAECKEAAGTTQMLAQQLLTRAVALLQQHDTGPSHASSILTKAQQLRLAAHAGLHWCYLPLSCRAYVHRVLDDLLLATKAHPQSNCREALAPLEILSLLAAAAPVSLRSPAAPLIPVHRFLLLQQQQRDPQQQHPHQLHSIQRRQQLRQRQDLQQPAQPIQHQRSGMLEQLEVQQPHCPSEAHQPQYLPQPDVSHEQAASSAVCSLAPASFSLPLPRGVERFLLREVPLPTASPLSRREPPAEEASPNVEPGSSQLSRSSGLSWARSLRASLQSATLDSSCSSYPSAPHSSAVEDAEAAPSAAVHCKENAALPLLPLLAPSPLKAWNHSSGFSQHFLPLSSSPTDTMRTPSRMRACSVVSLKQLCALLDGSACTHAIALPCSASLLPFFTSCRLLRLSRPSENFGDSFEERNSRFNVADSQTWEQEMDLEGTARVDPPFPRCAYASRRAAVALTDCWIPLPLENAAAASFAMAPSGLLGTETPQNRVCKAAEQENRGGDLPALRHLSHDSELQTASWRKRAAADEDEVGEDLSWDTTLSLSEAQRFSYLQKTVSPSFLSSTFRDTSSASACPAPTSPSSDLGSASVCRTLVPATLLLTVQRSLSRFTLLLGDARPLPTATAIPGAPAATAPSPAAAVTATASATAAGEDRTRSPGMILERGGRQKTEEENRMKRGNLCEEPLSGSSRSSCSSEVGSVPVSGGSGGSTHTNSRSSIYNSRSTSLHSSDENTLLNVQIYTCRFLSLLAHALCSRWTPALRSSCLLHALHSHVDALLLAVALHAAAKRRDLSSTEKCVVKGKSSSSTPQQKENTGEQHEHRLREHGQEEEEQRHQVQQQQQQQLQHQHQRGQQEARTFSESGAVSHDYFEKCLLNAEAPGSLPESVYNPNTLRAEVEVETATESEERCMRNRGQAQGVSDSNHTWRGSNSQSESGACSSGGMSERVTEVDAGDFSSSTFMTSRDGRSGNSDRRADVVDVGAAPTLEYEKNSKTIGAAGSAEKADEHAGAASSRGDMRQLREEAAACLATHLYSVSFLLRHLTLQAGGSAAASAAEGVQQQRSASGQGKGAGSRSCLSSPNAHSEISSSSFYSSSARAPASTSAAGGGTTAGDVRGEEAAEQAASQPLQEQHQEKEEDPQQPRKGAVRGSSLFVEPSPVSGYCSEEQGLEYLLPPAVEVLLSSVSRAAEALLTIEDGGSSPGWTGDQEVEAAKHVFYSAAVECLGALRRFFNTEYQTALRESIAFLFVIGSCATQKLQQSSQLAAAAAIDTRASICLFESLALVFHHLSSLRLPQESTSSDREQLVNSPILRKRRIDGKSDFTRADKIASCTFLEGDAEILSASETTPLNNEGGEDTVVHNAACDATDNLKDVVTLITTELTNWLPYAGNLDQGRVQRALHCFVEVQRRWATCGYDKKKGSCNLHSANTVVHHRNQGGDGLRAPTYLDFHKRAFIDEAHSQHFVEQPLTRGYNDSTFELQVMQPGGPVIETLLEEVLKIIPVEKMLNALKCANNQKKNSL